MNKVAIVAAMHGDEVYGIELHQRFVRAFPELQEHVQLIIGNEEAYRRQTRFIDADMNRQYRADGDAYELQQIRRVDELLGAFTPDYIIDVHTTRRNSGIFFISDAVNPRRQRIYDMLDIDVCIIEDGVITQSLIGNYPAAVSLEYSLASISEATTAEFVASLKNLVTAAEPSITNERLYTVSKLITKQDWERYPGLANYDIKSEGMALMVPKDTSEMDAEYFGFWCWKQSR